MFSKLQSLFCRFFRKSEVLKTSPRRGGSERDRLSCGRGVFSRRKMRFPRLFCKSFQFSGKVRRHADRTFSRRVTGSALCGRDFSPVSLRKTRRLTVFSEPSGGLLPAARRKAAAFPMPDFCNRKQLFFQCLAFAAGSDRFFPMPGFFDGKSIEIVLVERNPP